MPYYQLRTLQFWTSKGWWFAYCSALGAEMLVVVSHAEGMITSQIGHPD